MHIAIHNSDVYDLVPLSSTAVCPFHAMNLAVRLTCDDLARSF